MTYQQQFQFDFNDEQVQQLVDVIIDEFGTQLVECDLVESILLVLENVPGFELTTEQPILSVINLIRSKYYGK